MDFKSTLALGKPTFKLNTNINYGPKDEKKLIRSHYIQFKRSLTTTKQCYMHKKEHDGCHDKAPFKQ